MSSRASKERSSKRSGGGGGSQYPTAWSKWQWNDEYQCEVRYRLKASNDYEYQYGPQASEVPRDTSNLLTTIPEQQYSPQANQANYTTTSVENVTRELARTSLLPSTIQQPQVSQSYGSYAVPTSSDTQAQIQANIATRNPSTSFEKFDPHYKVHRGHEFQWGKVFKVLWSEPAGNNGSNAGNSEWSQRNGKHGEKFYEKVRRFVIVDARKGHCLCLPIMTYGGNGTMKNGVHANDHAIIYTEKPVWLPGEYERGLTKPAIRFVPDRERHKLDDASRLNYAKLYTVEYNVKVWFVGKIHRDSEYRLTTDYNSVHPPMPQRGPIPASEDTYGYAEGPSDTYQAPYPTYTSTTTYPAIAGSSAYPPSGYTASTAPYSNVQSTAPYQTERHETSQDPSYQIAELESAPSSIYDRENHYDE